MKSLTNLLARFSTRPADPDTAIAPPAWLHGREFSRDWALVHFPIWDRVLGARIPGIRDVLEIGSWEGMSALYFLNAFPDCRITCIDTFGGGVEHVDPTSPFYSPDISAIESRFDVNVASFGNRVRKIKSRSVPALDALAEENRTFDLVYVDGSHRRDDVFGDTALSWRLLNIGGILIWDDWGWRREAPSSDKPEHAIALFRRAFAPCLSILHDEYQLIACKEADWPLLRG
jgi:hypothetical protein